MLAALLAALAGLALAQPVAVPPPDSPAEIRLRGLADELRCLVCQNQTIADSNAPLAQDLRGQIRGQISQGRSDDQIRAYMVERYGDFVLYRPPVKPTTILLWYGPFVFLAAGAILLLFYLRRRRRQIEDPALSEKQRQQAEALLKDGKGNNA